MQTVDCRNMACPAPVITVKKALEAGGGDITVLLDNGAPRENVARFAHNRGFCVSEEKQGTGWLLTITGASTVAAEHPAVGGDTVFLILSDRMGDGPEELGRLLLKNFIHTLLETSELPSQILFLNTGVKLAVNGSDVLEALLKLEGMGVELFSCGLCLDFFSVRDSLAVGKVTNMLSTAEKMLAAAKVVRI